MPKEGIISCSTVWSPLLHLNAKLCSSGILQSLAIPNKFRTELLPKKMGLMKVCSTLYGSSLSHAVLVILPSDDEGSWDDKGIIDNVCLASYSRVVLIFPRDQELKALLVDSLPVGSSLTVRFSFLVVFTVLLITAVLGHLRYMSFCDSAGCATLS